MTVRKPPPLLAKRFGRCSYCGSTDLPGRRRYWCSDLCVDRWSLCQGRLRRAGFALLVPGVSKGSDWLIDDYGINLEHRGYFCAGCQGWFRFHEIEVDHIRPLWSLTETERQDRTWWEEGNLQLLCRPCHVVKTSAEAELRGRVRQGQMRAREMERSGQGALSL